MFHLLIANRTLDLLDQDDAAAQTQHDTSATAQYQHDNQSSVRQHEGKEEMDQPHANPDDNTCPEVKVEMTNLAESETED